MRYKQTLQYLFFPFKNLDIYNDLTKEYPNKRNCFIYSEYELNKLHYEHSILKDVQNS